MKHFIFVLLLVWVSGCSGLLEDLDSWDDMSFDFGDGVEGTWSIRANGDLEECSEYPELNGPIVLRVDDLQVTQSSTGKLTLVGGEPEGFSFKNGLYDYPSFRFDTVEETSLGTVKLFFEGSDDFGSLYGNFTGDGPGSCRIKNGTFDLLVERTAAYEEGEGGEADAEEGGEADAEEGGEADAEEGGDADAEEGAEADTDEGSEG